MEHWLHPSIEACPHKVLTYIEYRAVSGVLRTIDPHPLSTQRVCPPPATKARGYTLAGRAGVGGQYCSSEDARHWIVLLQYNPSTPAPYLRALRRFDDHCVESSFTVCNFILCILAPSTSMHVQLNIRIPFAITY
jgi:hypothetical protein